LAGRDAVGRCIFGVSCLGTYAQVPKPSTYVPT
jgi:hypothetical protein